MERIYLDNASTSFPKAPGAAEAMYDYVKSCGCNVSRGGYDEAYRAEELVLDTRQRLTRLFHGPDCRNVVFTKNITESLNVLLGGKPFEDKDCSDRFKLGVLQYLNAQYGITEEDFISAELEVVPAGKARDIGFDRSFIASYGHDDRVCAYAELAGIFDAVSPKKTAVCILSLIHI